MAARKSAEFRKAINAASAVRRAQTKLQREILKKCDWWDPDDVAEWRRNNRRRRKSGLVPPDRICRCCGQGPLLGPKQWVTSGKIVCCKSCHQRAVPVTNGEKVRVRGIDVFPGVQKMYLLDGKKMMDLRLKMGLSVREVARRAGWASSYYSRLETEIQSVSKDVVDTYLKAMQQLGAETDDVDY